MSFQPGNDPLYNHPPTADISTKKTFSTKSYQESPSSALENIENNSTSRPHKSARNCDKKGFHSKSHHKSSHSSKAHNPPSSTTSTHKQSSSKTQHKSSSKPKHKHAPSDPLVTYLQDSTHTNPGYSTTYTQGLINAYGFPEEPAAREDLESEIVKEARAKVQLDIEGMSRLRLE